MNNTLIIYIIFIILSAFIGWYSTMGIKTQYVRLIDIFIYGPFFIWLGFKRTKKEWERILLYFIGATTITYNLKNYLMVSNLNK